MSLKHTFQNKVVQPVFRLLKQGLSPQKITASLIAGMVISVFPCYGIPTLLCIVVSARLRLNLPLVQGINYLGGAPQLLLFIPFMRLGERVWFAEPFPLALPELRHLIAEQGFGFVIHFYHILLHAITGWVLTAPAMGLLSYLIVSPWINRISAQRQKNYLLHHPEEHPTSAPYNPASESPPSR